MQEQDAEKDCQPCLRATAAADHCQQADGRACSQGVQVLSSEHVLLEPICQGFPGPCWRQAACTTLDTEVFQQQRLDDLVDVEKLHLDYLCSAEDAQANAVSAMQESA